MPGGKGNINGDDCTNGFDKRPEDINRTGRPKGSKNRTTIVRMILEQDASFPEKVFKRLKEIYPNIEKQMSVEEIMTIIQAKKAITKGDTQAYKALMDSGYGFPKHEFEQHIIPESQVYKLKDGTIIEF